MREQTSERNTNVLTFTVTAKASARGPGVISGGPGMFIWGL